MKKEEKKQEVRRRSLNDKDKEKVNGSPAAQVFRSHAVRCCLLFFSVFICSSLLYLDRDEGAEVRRRAAVTMVAC